MEDSVKGAEFLRVLAPLRVVVGPGRFSYSVIQR